MVVIADTSPLNYLILIGEVELLAGLYRRILIPQAVIDELRHADAPPLVRRFATAPPHWLEEVDVDKADLLVAAEAMPDLDAGELAAIALAGMYPNPLLLMDEAAGRAEAARRGSDYRHAWHSARCRRRWPGRSRFRIRETIGDHVPASADGDRGSSGSGCNPETCPVSLLFPSKRSFGSQLPGVVEGANIATL